MENSFLRFPNAPEGRVGSLAVGERYAALIADALSERGIEVLTLPENPFVDERLASHADLCLLHLGGARFVLSEYLGDSAFADRLLAHNAELSFSPNPLSPQYPYDAALCALVLGNAIFHNSAHTAIVSNDLVHIRQGYAKCVVCPVDSSAAITSDPGLAAAMEKRGADVLRIAPGHILLPGFDTGFIGGSSFKLSRDTLAFTGRLDEHPDRDEIERFLDSRGVRPLYLTERPIFDIGSAVLLTENVEERISQK